MKRPFQVEYALADSVPQWNKYSSHANLKLAQKSLISAKKQRGARQYCWRIRGLETGMLHT